MKPIQQQTITELRATVAQILDVIDHVLAANDQSESSNRWIRAPDAPIADLAAQFRDRMEKLGIPYSAVTMNLGATPVVGTNEYITRRVMNSDPDYLLLVPRDYSRGRNAWSNRGMRVHKDVIHTRLCALESSRLYGSADYPQDPFPASS